MRNDDRRTDQPKGVYRVRNWREYPAGLIGRGNVTMWIDEGIAARVPETGPSRRGRACVCTDAGIQMLPGIRQVLRLPLRARQGFAQRLRDLAFAGLPVPNYDRRKSLWDTTLSRRAQEPEVVLPTFQSGDPLHLVVDSTGLKLYGEGEWKVRKHGYPKRRTWRQVHLAMDANTGQTGAVLMTHQGVGDAGVRPDRLEQIPADVPISTIGGDRAYDTKQSRASITARGAMPSIPPREGAMPWPDDTPGAGWRNGAIDAIAQDGRGDGKKRSGYHRRSPVETLMFRLKTLTGNRLWARRTGSQAAEGAIRAGVLNRMAMLARPHSVRIA